MAISFELPATVPSLMWFPDVNSDHDSQGSAKQRFQLKPNVAISSLDLWLAGCFALSCSFVDSRTRDAIFLRYSGYTFSEPRLRAVRFGLLLAGVTNLPTPISAGTG